MVHFGIPVWSARELYTSDSELAHRKPGFVEIGCADPSAFIAWSPGDQQTTVQLLCAAYDRVRAGTLTKTSLNDLEVVTGLHANPHGLLASSILPACANWNLVETATYDWVHNMLQGGVFTLECEAILKSAEAFGITRNMIKLFLGDASWKYPQSARSKAVQLHRIFDERRVSDTKPSKVKASCSELLGVYGLLRLFFETKVAGIPELAGNLKSFKSCCQVLDTVMAAKNSYMPVAQAADQMEQAVTEFMRCHQSVYGTEYIKPKHHWLMDVPDQFRRDGLVLDAFVIERTHISVKKLAEHIRNTSTYERTLISGMLVVQLREGRADRVTGPRLIGSTAVLPGTEIQVADKLTVWSFEVCVGDAVVRVSGGDPGIVSACAELSDGTLCCLVSELQKVANVTDHSGKYLETGRLIVWHATSVQLCRAWRQQPDGCVFVVYR